MSATASHVTFNVSQSDSHTLREIATRAATVAYQQTRVRVPVLEILMDLVATHANGCPLRLEALLAADDFNLIHDVFGIRRHLDRDTGKLGDCFLPRFAQPTRQAA